jgi:hypothetical protein
VAEVAAAVRREWLGEPLVEGGGSAEAVGLEELLGDGLGVLLVDVGLLEHAGNRLGGELRGDGVEGSLDLVGAVDPHERDDVLRAEVLLGVLERDEVVGRDRRVGGVDVRDVGLPVLERLDDALAGERPERPELDAVGLLETGMPCGRSLNSGGAVSVKSPATALRSSTVLRFLSVAVFLVTTIESLSSAADLSSTTSDFGSTCCTCW